MNDVKSLPKQLIQSRTFSKKEFVSAMAEEYSMTATQIAYDLQKRLDQGMIIHVGWDKYTIPGEKRLYSHKYSNEAEIVAEKINDSFFDLRFQILELVQLNVFVNHQIAHNTIFVSVENELQDYVFDALRDEYQGRIMLRPSLTEYYRYVNDNEIIIMRLPSDTPKEIDESWHSRLEKIIVDVLTDKLVGGIVPDGEKKNIVKGAFDTYLLDENTMIRYAKRKGSVKKLQTALKDCGVKIK